VRLEPWKKKRLFKPLRQFGQLLHDYCDQNSSYTSFYIHLCLHTLLNN
jgi:hypothetical protein